MEALEVARRAVEIASDQQANDIVLLDGQGVLSFTDYLVICSGDSSRQVAAIYDEIKRLLKQEDVSVHHNEGTVDSGWLLLDLGDVMVHIFSQAEREYYQLDELWSKATTVLRIQ
ncbi:ribosome silencing factor [Chloroflexota bacterium]